MTDGVHNDPPPTGSPLDRLIRFCLENKLLVLLFVLLVVGLGIAFAPFDWHMPLIPRGPVPVDAIPNIGENQQVVFTSWMGRSPEDVEDQVTYPLTVSLLGVPGVETIRSKSMLGFSTVYVVFKNDIEFYWSRSRILEKLNSLPAGTLPEGVQPALGPDATALGQIFWYTLEGRDPNGEVVGGWDLQELRSIQDWKVRYALMSAEGVSEAASVGGYQKEYQIDVDPDAMHAHRVTLDQVFRAAKNSNIDVGARTIEVNRVEYIIRGLGFIEDVDDIRSSVVAVNENVPIRVGDVAHVTTGPAGRRGALDKGGAEAVGGVVVVRHGYNPLAAINNVKEKIEQIAPGLDVKPVVDRDAVSRQTVEGFARSRGFEAYNGPELNREGWMNWLRSTPREDWPDWVTTSRVTIVPFYDRTGLIYETLGTLRSALTEEVLVTIIVVILSVLHLRSSLLISGALPLAVLMCFIAMKAFRVDANIVSLSGIAIAIGTIVDMSIIVCENILRHLGDAGPDEDRLEVVFRASSEVGSAVLTAVMTTIVSFLPVFTMTGAEGKLFRPLAFTKTFALVGSIIVALMVVPAGAHVLFAGRLDSRALKRAGTAGLVVGGIVVGWALAWWAGLIMIALGIYHLAGDRLPASIRKGATWLAAAVAVAFVAVLLTEHWVPLGPERGLARNLVFVGGLIGGLLGFFYLVRLFYEPVLRWSLAHKLPVLGVTLLVVLFGIVHVWLGPGSVLGPLKKAEVQVMTRPAEVDRLVEARLIERRAAYLLWTDRALRMDEAGFREALKDLEVGNADSLTDLWEKDRELVELSRRNWGTEEQTGRRYMRNRSLATILKWTFLKGWQGLGKEFMPPLDEGSFLWMPTTMPHASIGEALEVLRKQDMAFGSVPEVGVAVGKIGRARTALDPAPISMVETVINYIPEYITDEAGHRVNFRYDREREEFVRDENGELIRDPDGRPFRQWRDEIRTADDIWDEIVEAGRIVGTTSAPKLQPIAARLVMLQSGMRAPMGVKVKGASLSDIESIALDVERLLKQVSSVQPDTVVADRVVGKPYLEIDINLEAVSRYEMSVRRVQNTIRVALGGRRITTTVEGRERYPVRARYKRELRDDIESLGEILVAAPDGTQIPLAQLAEVRYQRGPMVIKSEDTRLVGYVVFDKKAGYAEVDVVNQCRQFLQAAEDSGQLARPAGVTYEFAGSYENQIRARKTLSVVLPGALFVIFLILYFQFRSVPSTFLVFSGIVVAWAGGFILIWLYNQPWFMDFAVFGVNLRSLFQMPTIDPATGGLVNQVNLSVAVWVGFLALFGIASDNGVVIATYLDQSFAERQIGSTRDIRDATVAGAARRIRPCLMTSATTILALIPVLTSTGRGADVMVPMAIPSFGGMLVVLLSVFAVPLLYCVIEEFRHHTGWSKGTMAAAVFATGGLALVGMTAYCAVHDLVRGEGERATA